MKPTFRAILFCLLPLSALRAEEPAAPVQKQLPYQIEFSNLPEEKRNAYGTALAEAQRLFGEKRVFEAVEKAGAARAIFENDPTLLTLMGACQVEFRNFDKAMEYFKKADSLTPDQPSIIFNIAELNFVTKDWEAAETNLSKVIRLSEANVTKGDIQLSRLVEFKLLLTKLKLGKKDEAAQLAKKYDFLDDSPYPYYAEAAILFSEEKDVAAEAAIARANRIFRNPGILSPWQDTMVEFGYVKGFFGGDEDPGATK
jgi:tetratricopeptide (TPR) repeat protein